MRCELHVHTTASPDSLLTPEALLEVCRRRGLERVAVTDHNTLTAALYLKERDPQRIIVGEEVRTDRGELIAYFLTEPLPVGRSPEETIAAVRAQGGVVGAPHPLDRFRHEALGQDALLPLLGTLDFLEGFNARCLCAADNDAAQALARAHDLPIAAGSDAHCAWELGRAVMDLPPFDNPTSFLKSLREGRKEGRLSPWWVHLLSTYAKVTSHRGGR